MVNYFKKASGQKDITGNALLKLLESRLDNVIYKAGFSKSRAQARQMVNHGLFKINSTHIDIPSFHTKPGDKFEVIPRVRKSKLFEALEKQKFGPAKWLKVDYKNLSGEVERELEPTDLEQAISTSLVVEYYSK